MVFSTTPALVDDEGGEKKAGRGGGTCHRRTRPFSGGLRQFWNVWRWVGWFIYLPVLSTILHALFPVGGFVDELLLTLPETGRKDYHYRHCRSAYLDMNMPTGGRANYSIMYPLYAYFSVLVAWCVFKYCVAVYPKHA